ncbi:MAG TPA: sulfotransferase [Kofleriaceae bacterium]|nr:sulfotransferase [Kofleriaceae bacterium]
MTLPNFLILGTQKAGTRWMRTLLVQHPDVFMPEEEVHFFDNAENFARGRSWYEAKFAGARGQKAIGEKTPNYFITDKTDPLAMPRRIHDLLPDARLIAILRNPVERAISAINHHMRVGYVAADVDLDTEVRRFVAEERPFIRYGFYQQHLAAYHTFYDPAQLLVLIYEDDVVAQPLATLRRVCSFLGIDPTFGFTGIERRYNEGRLSDLGLRIARRLPVENHLAVRLVSAAERLLGRRAPKKRPSSPVLDYLYQVYAPENEKLFRMIGRDVPSWSPEKAHITR